MIKNIVFDFGGVLLTEDDVWLTSRKTKMLLGIEDQKIMNEAWNLVWPDGRDGKTNEDDFFKTFLEKLDIKADTKLIYALKNIYRQETNVYSAYPILKSLKNKYKLFGLPNITKDWLDYKINHFELNKYLNLVVSSCGEGIAKPNKEIFLSLINKGQIDPTETLFVDNMVKNIIPAKELRFKTHLYTDLEKLKVEFDDQKIYL